MCVCVSLSLSMYVCVCIYIYIYIHVCVHMYNIYIYIYIYNCGSCWQRPIFLFVIPVVMLCVSVIRSGFWSPVSQQTKPSCEQKSHLIAETICLRNFRATGPKSLESQNCALITEDSDWTVQPVHNRIIFCTQNTNPWLLMILGLQPASVLTHLGWFWNNYTQTYTSTTYTNNNKQ